MNNESRKKDVENHSGDWLLKYDDLVQRLDLVREILNKYPRCAREALPDEKVEIGYFKQHTEEHYRLRGVQMAERL